MAHASPACNTEPYQVNAGGARSSKEGSHGFTLAMFYTVHSPKGDRGSTPRAGLTADTHGSWDEDLLRRLGLVGVRQDQQDVHAVHDLTPPSSDQRRGSGAPFSPGKATKASLRDLHTWHLDRCSDRWHSLDLLILRQATSQTTDPKC